MEFRDGFERDLELDEQHLYDGRCRKCGHTAIRRGNAWFHSVVTICTADQDPDNDYFKFADDPLANCHCTRCAEKRSRNRDA